MVIINNIYLTESSLSSSFSSYHPTYNLTSHHVEVNNYNNKQTIPPTSSSISYYQNNNLISHCIENNINYNNNQISSIYPITSYSIEVNNYNQQINNSIINPQTTINNLNYLTSSYSNEDEYYNSELININNYNISPLLYTNNDTISNISVINNCSTINDDNNYIIIDETNKYTNNNKSIIIENEKNNKNYEIVKKIGDFQFECKYGNKKLNEMEVVDREILKNQFKTFAYSARNIIFNLMSINGYKYKRNVVVECIDPYIFYYFFKEMEGAKFKKCYEKLKKNGMKKKIPCISFKFNNILPVLHNVNTWGIHSYTTNI
ncbi:hypothetical protein ABK040_006200 [Willaertia magna]